MECNIRSGKHYIGPSVAVDFLHILDDARRAYINLDAAEAENADLRARLEAAKRDMNKITKI